MNLLYGCPHCGREVSAEALSEVSRDAKNVIYLCSCPNCNKPTEVKVPTSKILTFATNRLFDRFGFSYN